MDPVLHDKLRARIRSVIAEKAGLKPPAGGFLPLLPMAAAAAPFVAPLAHKAIGWLGDKIFGSGADEIAAVEGEGKYWSHKATAKTRKPNAHARKVKEIMNYYASKNTPISLGEASKLAKAELSGAPRAAKPRKRKQRKD